MLLSDFFPASAVLRDAEFTQLCLSNSETDGPALSFLDDARFARELFANPAIRAVICRSGDVSSLPEHIGGIVTADNPRRAYFELHNRLAALPDYCPMQTPSVIPASCHISPLAYIAPTGVMPGENVTVEEFVTVKGPCRIGDNCVLHAGAKIGGAGYEFKYFGDDVLDVTHCGGVEIGSNVIVWENTAIFRAVYPWDKTMIGDNTRIDAHVHIAHGAKIGDCVKVGVSSIIAGRVSVNDHAFIGPGVIISNRLKIGAHAKILLGSVVTKDIPAGATVSGNFAIDHAAHLEQVKLAAQGVKLPLTDFASTDMKGEF